MTEEQAHRVLGVVGFICQHGVRQVGEAVEPDGEGGDDDQCEQDELDAGEPGEAGDGCCCWGWLCAIRHGIVPARRQHCGELRRNQYTRGSLVVRQMSSGGWSTMWIPGGAAAHNPDCDKSDLHRLNVTKYPLRA